MIAAGALGWALAAGLVVLILLAGWVLRPRVSRRLGPAGVSDNSRAGSIIERVGRRVLTIRAAEHDPTEIRCRQVGALVLLVAPAAMVDVRVGFVMAGAAIALPLFRARRAVDERHNKVLQELPEVIDLLTVAVAGGLTVPLAVGAVARRVPGEVAVAFARCRERAALGRRLADELDLIPDLLGDATRPLIRALVSAERYGTPIVDALGRVSADVRIERRRNAEITARRLPIKLLFPLVACVLPAFVLLTVVPVLAGSLESIRS